MAVDAYKLEYLRHTAVEACNAGFFYRKRTTADAPISEYPRPAALNAETVGIY